MDEAAAELVHFADRLRAEGVVAPPSAVLDWARACGELPDHDLYWAGRSTLVKDRDAVLVYDRLFAEVFGGADPTPVRDGPGEAAQEPSPAAEDGDGGEQLGGELASAVEQLRQRDFARCDDAELAALIRLINRIGVALPHRETRRWRSARRGRVDLRGSVRADLRTAGVGAAALRRRVRRTRPRRLVLLVDVSGSMSDYARALLLFAQAATRGNHPVEVFCFGTRLTRVTEPLQVTDPSRALDDAAATVLDWDGGTRIGHSVKAFLDEYGHRGLARGAVVLICSDGLERDEPALLAQQMARLHRLAHTVVWLNPLKGDSRYAPVARGMRAALPHVDVFLAGHNLASLEELAALLPGMGDSRGVARPRPAAGPTVSACGS